MRVRIRKKKFCNSYYVEWYPEYKSAWYMPWRRITDKQGNKYYTSGNPVHLEQDCLDVKNGKRPPTYPKQNTKREL